MTALAVLLASAAGWMALGPDGRTRLGPMHADVRAAGARSMPRALPVVPVAVLLGLGLWVAVGGMLGLLLAAAAIVIVPRLLGLLEPSARRRRREDLARQGPQAADLLAAILASGAPPIDAIAVVARALGPPMAEDLDAVVRMLQLGAAPAEAWAVIGDDHPLAALRAAFRRSATSGAPLHAVLTALADDARRRRRAAIEVAARSAGIRAVGPLAACFLPAFILIGVVPVVAGFVVAFQ